VIRILAANDAEAYARLRHEMLVDAPLAFASSPEDAVAPSLDDTRERLERAPESVVFGAFEPELVGAVGIYRDPHVKAAHKAHVWGMYVAPAHRSRGLARALLDATLEHAAKLPGVECVQLGVSSAAPAARHLYERAGFEEWGAEPDALRHGGEAIVKFHLARRL
jgi:ribosomal protein S18 acetylase RimI-like enzyme